MSIINLTLFLFITKNSSRLCERWLVWFGTNRLLDREASCFACAIDGHFVDVEKREGSVASAPFQPIRLNHSRNAASGHLPEWEIIKSGEVAQMGGSTLKNYVNYSFVSSHQSASATVAFETVFHFWLSGFLIGS